MLETREPSVVLSVDEHVETVYQIIAETLALGRPGVFPRLYELLDEVFRQRRPATASPPWLMLPIFACEALHGEMRHAQQVAAAFEVGRLAAGCLDEWQDQDAGDAMWQTAGPARTVNAAMAMLALSFLAVAHLADLGLPGELVLALQREFQQCLLHMCEGQDADLSDGLSLGDYEAVAGAKSGTLFGLGCRAGAIVAGAPTDVADGYGEFGHNLGILVQIWNDLEGMAGRRGKRDAVYRRSLPLLAAQSLGPPADEPGSAEAQAGNLYALVRLQAYHQRAAAALARCPAPGRLAIFLEEYSTGHLAQSAARSAQPDGEGHAPQKF